MKLTPIKHTFIFKFLDDINSKGQFNKNTTESGILLQASFDDSAKESRWVKVTSTGPDCVKVKVDDVVLLPALRWTSGVKFDDGKVWKSDQQEVVAVDNGTSLTTLHNFVVFEQIKPTEDVSPSGLVIITNVNDDTPCGKVIAVGPDCVDVQEGDTLYYDDANFFDTFVYNGKTLAFIKEPNILALS